MSVFNRYEKCFGITLYRFGQYRAEIWFCPSSYKIVEHSHPHENVQLMYLFGSTRFYRRDLNNGIVESVKAGWRMLFKCFTVKYYHSHWFEVGGWPLIFINFQHFLPNTTPRSAAKDFEVTREDQKINTLFRG